MDHHLDTGIVFQIRHYYEMENGINWLCCTMLQCWAQQASL